MGLSYHFEFRAPTETSADELEDFLTEVGLDAQSAGLNPAIVLNVRFDTPERREFARRLGGSLVVHDERLKGLALPAPGQLFDCDPVAGEGRLIPTQGVVLVVTDERGCEVCFGFLKYPGRVVDTHGRTLAESGLGGAWAFRDFIDSPDPRYREIVARFEAAGYARRVRDEFA